MDAHNPGPLARDVLDRPDIRAALIEHDFAAAFALIKKWGGLSQNKIASACQLTPGKVSTIIGGTHRVTSFDVICRIADGLHIPGHMLGLAARPWEAQQPPSSPEPPTPSRPDEVPWRPDTTVELATDLTRSELVMDRRTMTRALTGMAATGTALLDPLEGWLQPPASPARARHGGRLGAQDVAELEQTAQELKHWSRRYGGGLRRKAVLGQLNDVAEALDEHQTSAVETGLYRVMAQLAGTAASTAWDMGLHGRAQDYYRLALRAAHAGGDRVHGANILAGMARQMLYNGHPDDALQLVQFAQEGARDVVGPRVQAMLHTREAWAYAALGRVAGFERATARAREALENAGGGTDPEPYWIAYFDHSELSGVTGSGFLNLARQAPERYAGRAADEFRTALAVSGPEVGPRGYALDVINLAECLFLLGDTTSAADQTARAIEVARQTRSGRVREQLTQLYPYTVGHDTSRPLREARNNIRDLLST
ncbi:hypothetical protein ACFVIM_11110 [Streptomyces sp. NPDC057638]|uniref:hypothetical protein n=1 Tax=Streptomyces sp. NPDC057638 TaxID=3346190 RepID=UPI0036B5537D